eukprot:g2320.t1
MTTINEKFVVEDVEAHIDGEAALKASLTEAVNKHLENKGLAPLANAINDDNDDQAAEVDDDEGLESGNSSENSGSSESSGVGGSSTANQGQSLNENNKGNDTQSNGVSRGTSSPSSETEEQHGIVSNKKDQEERAISLSPNDDGYQTDSEGGEGELEDSLEDRFKYANNVPHVPSLPVANLLAARERQAAVQAAAEKEWLRRENSAPPPGTTGSQDPREMLYRNLMGGWMQFDAESKMDIVAAANSLLGNLGVLNTSISSYPELCESASTIFVVVFQSLFGIKLKGIVQVPTRTEHFIHNAQLVIDTLSNHVLGIKLKHINGVDICLGDPAAIKNLIDIFAEIMGIITSRTRGGGKKFRGGVGKRNMDIGLGNNVNIPVFSSVLKTITSGAAQAAASKQQQQQSGSGSGMKSKKSRRGRQNQQIRNGVQIPRTYRRGSPTRRVSFSKNTKDIRAKKRSEKRYDDDRDSMKKRSKSYSPSRNHKRGALESSRTYSYLSTSKLLDFNVYDGDDHPDVEAAREDDENVINHQVETLELAEAPGNESGINQQQTASGISSGATTNNGSDETQELQDESNLEEQVSSSSNEIAENKDNEDLDIDWDDDEQVDAYLQLEASKRRQRSSSDQIEAPMHESKSIHLFTQGLSNITHKTGENHHGAARDRYQELLESSYDDDENSLREDIVRQDTVAQNGNGGYYYHMNHHHSEQPSRYSHHHHRHGSNDTYKLYNEQKRQRLRLFNQRARERTLAIRLARTQEDLKYKALSHMMREQSLMDKMIREKKRKVKRRARARLLERRKVEKEQKEFVYQQKLKQLKALESFYNDQCDLMKDELEERKRRKIRTRKSGSTPSRRSRSTIRTVEPNRTIEVYKRASSNVKLNRQRRAEKALRNGSSRHASSDTRKRGNRRFKRSSNQTAPKLAWQGQGENQMTKTEGTPYINEDVMVAMDDEYVMESYATVDEKSDTRFTANGYVASPDQIRIRQMRQQMQNSKKSSAEKKPLKKQKKKKKKKEYRVKKALRTRLHLIYASHDTEAIHPSSSSSPKNVNKPTTRKGILKSAKKNGPSTVHGTMIGSTNITSSSGSLSSELGNIDSFRKKLGEIRSERRNLSSAASSTAASSTTNSGSSSMATTTKFQFTAGLGLQKISDDEDRTALEAWQQVPDVPEQ